jgi:D-alanyl-D-alanine carboxypeptidase
MGWIGFGGTMGRPRGAVALLVVIGLLSGACTGSTPASAGPTSTPVPATEAPVQATASVAPSPSLAVPAYALGHFPAAPRNQLPDATARVLQATLDAAVKGGLPGITATVLVAGVGSWSGAAGTADGVRPVEVRSQFAIASLTKTVIAAEIMWLAEQGKLRLSDPVADHLPAGFHFDTNGSTIEDLLSMRSGIPDPISEESGPVQANLLKAWTPEELLATVPAYRNQRPASSEYEDANYMLLSLVVGATTGMPVPAALRVHVLADPRFVSMVYQPDERPVGPLALPFLGGQVRPNILALGGGYLPSRSESSGGGSGGMASDCGALALWGYQLFGGQIVSEASLRAMTDFGTGATYDGYGLGVFDLTNLDQGFGVQSVGNGGWDSGGYSSILAVQPSKGVAISVLTNTAGNPVQLVVPVAQQLAASLH